MANFLFYRYKFVQGPSDASLLTDTKVAKYVDEHVLAADAF